MAKAKDDAKQPTVRRIKAKDDSKSIDTRSRNSESLAATGNVVKPKRRPLGSFLGYFKGAWVELRQVRWPNRRATFSMTGALLAFTAIFAVFILVIDLVFENLFKLIVG